MNPEHAAGIGTPRPLGLLLAPGAGADRDQPALVAIDRRASSLGLLTARMDFPYRKAGRRAPDRPPVLLAAVADAAAELRAAGAGALVLGGRSMGGRMCSMAVAGVAGTAGVTGGAAAATGTNGTVDAAGLVLISYPLHPPARTDKRRTEHLPRLRVPCLFVSGTRDPFATPAELEAATAAIPGPVTHHFIDGGDHGLRRHDEAVAVLVADWISAQFLRTSPARHEPPG